MKYRHVLSRRTMLRGFGGAAIALPFLDEMRSSTAYAADVAPACVTYFFGNGIPVKAFNGGLTGRVAPLSEIAARSAIHARVNLTKSFHGPATEASLRGKANAGPSIEQYVRHKKYAGGVVPTRLTNLSAGIYWRTDEGYKYKHSFDMNGDSMDTNPPRSLKAIFDRLFVGFKPPGNPGTDPVPTPSGPNLKRSVLDAVVADYKFYTSSAGNLGATSRERIKSHLDRIYEVEKTLPGLDAQMQNATNPSGPLSGGSSSCKVPAATNEGQLPDPNNNGVPPISPDLIESYWKKMVDLYAMGLHCDIFRFGNLMASGSAERIIFKGSMNYNGQTRSVNHGKNGHDYWHDWSPSNNFAQELEEHINFVCRQMVFFVKALDDKAYVQANGKTFWENQLVVVTTELDNHSNMDHATDRTFHLVSPAGGKIKPGVLMAESSPQVTYVDFYETLLKGFGIENPSDFGLASQRKGLATGVLA
ncbi:MAG: DUF1552 domain-containing protein [Deltaproteobacteria bacterium]|nr:DUF1552 domain-containing protein [Deltaproteobacteria bacterium]